MACPNTSIVCQILCHLNRFKVNSFLPYKSAFQLSYFYIPMPASMSCTNVIWSPRQRSYRFSGILWAKQQTIVSQLQTPLLGLLCDPGSGTLQTTSLPEAVVLCQYGAPEGSWDTRGEKRPHSSLFCCCSCQLQLSNGSSPQLWKLVPVSFIFSPELPEQLQTLSEKAAAARQCLQRSRSQLSGFLLGASRFSSYCSSSLRSYTLASCKCYHLVASESPIQFFSSLSSIYLISCIKFCQQPDSSSFSD